MSTESLSCRVFFFFFFFSLARSLRCYTFIQSPSPELAFQSTNDSNSTCSATFQLNKQASQDSSVVKHEHSSSRLVPTTCCVLIRLFLVTLWQEGAIYSPLIARGAPVQVWVTLGPFSIDSLHVLSCCFSFQGLFSPKICLQYLRPNGDPKWPQGATVGVVCCSMFARLQTKSAGISLNPQYKTLWRNSTWKWLQMYLALSDSEHLKPITICFWCTLVFYHFYS